MSRKMLLALALALATISPVVSALQLITFIPDNVIALSGQNNVNVPLKLENNDSVLSIEFQVNHTQHIYLKNVTTTARVPNAIVEWKQVTPKSALVVVLAPDNISAGSGTVLNLVFNVNSSAVPGIYTVDINHELLLNLDYNITYSASDSLFTII